MVDCWEAGRAADTHALPRWWSVKRWEFRGWRVGRFVEGKCVCRVSGPGGVGTVETGNVRRGRAQGVRRGGPMSRVLNRVPPPA